MIYRSDDITVDTDVVKLRLLDQVFDKELLAVVYKGGLDCGELPFNENSELMRFLKEKIERGSEIALHGYYHHDITKLETGYAIWELIKAKRAIEELLETKIHYYIPFQHKITQEIIDYLKVIGIETLTDDGQDLVQLMKDNQPPNKGYRQLWYHWWEIDYNNLTTFIERTK